MKFINFFRRNYYFYPFVFPVIPILSLFHSNFEKASVKDLILPAQFTLVVLAGAVLFSLVLSKKKEKLFINIFLFMSMVQNYGLLIAFLNGVRRFYYFQVEGIKLLLVWIFAFVYLFHVVSFSRRKLVEISKSIAFSVYCLVAILVVSLGVKNYSLQKEKSNIDTRSEYADKETLDERMSSGRDIYYIVIDRYANQQVLLNHFNYDNSEFYNQLRAMGFCIAEESSANYLKTAHSLASSLNYDYLNNMLGKVDGGSQNWDLIYDLIRKNKVVEFLTKRGYEHVNVGSWWSITKKDPLADKNFNYGSLPEFFSVYYENTLVKPTTKITNLYDTDHGIWLQNKKQLDYLGSIFTEDRPVFVFAHLLTVHEPFVTMEDGAYMTKKVFAILGLKAAYVNQLKYTNNRILEILENLTKRDSPPIVLLQSDEGPHPDKYWRQGEQFNYGDADDENLNLKMKILNSYFLPGKKCDDLTYPKMSPVNSFRLVFNEYFEQNLDYLEDRSYIYPDSRYPFRLEEITEKLETTKEDTQN